MPLRMLALIAIHMTALAWGASFSELDEHAKSALAGNGKAQAQLDRLLAEKLGDDWRLTPEEIAEATQTLEQARYSIEFPATRSCNPWPKYLDRASYRAKLEEQIHEAASFLAEYHFRMLGRNSSLFKIRRIVICTASRYWRHRQIELDRFKSELTLHAGPTRLWLVGNGPITADNLNTLTAKELLAKWNEGEQWSQDTLVRDIVDRRKNPVRGHWPLLDPVGETRVLLREFIRRAGLHGARKVRGWLDAGADALRTALTERARALPSGEAASTRLAQLGADELRAVAERWVEKLVDPKATDDMSVAAVVATLKKRVERQRQMRIERTQIGFVNVENFHDIAVELTVGDARDFQDFVIVPENVDISVTQYGIVNVSTTDRVAVRAALAAMGAPESFEKATLKSVLKALRYIE